MVDQKPCGNQKPNGRSYDENHGQWRHRQKKFEASWSFFFFFCCVSREIKNYLHPPFFDIIKVSQVFDVTSAGCTSTPS
jgi:hypothetical protein